MLTLPGAEKSGMRCAKDECDNMENKVSDNVIEKNYRECFKFNEINESGACNFDMSTARLP
mgnify:CR=1 FL=1